MGSVEWVAVGIGRVCLCGAWWECGGGGGGGEVIGGRLECSGGWFAAGADGVFKMLRFGCGNTLR